MPARSKQYWLVKTEPDVFSLTDLKNRPNQTENWDGVRNYQARNYIRDEMKKGDLALFYHSRCDPPGCVGIAEIVSNPFPDSLAFDPDSNYYDEKSDPEDPRWFCVEVKFYEEFKRTVSLPEMKERPELADMRVVAKGNRLSVMPVEKDEFDLIRKLGREKPKS
ncbi:MAG: EVE domain-containing protein [Opitutales bacterium]